MTASAIAPGAPFRSMATERHALLASVAASLVLHLGALVLFPEVRFHAPGAASPRMLTARLAPRAPEPDPSPAVEPDTSRGPRAAEPSASAQKRGPEPSGLQQAPRSALAAPERSPQPAQQASLAPATAVPQDGSPQVEAATASLAPLQVRETPAPAPRLPVSRPTPAADAQTLDQYRLALIGVARHYKRYPARAVENGWQGRVEVRLVIGANGSTQKASIKTSSGYEILDKEALEMIRKAKPLAPIPQSLRGREFTVDIPVIFDLQTG